MKTQLDWTRVNNDVNGNPRFVCHYLSFLRLAGIETSQGDIQSEYSNACKIANKIGGRKFHNKQFGGGIVFQSYSLPDTEKHIKELNK
jgi:hypothetical protein